MGTEIGNGRRGETGIASPSTTFFFFRGVMPRDTGEIKDKDSGIQARDGLTTGNHSKDVHKAHNNVTSSPTVSFQLSEKSN